MWVVKLGGSLAADGLLKDWLEMLAECGRGRVVVVPGGGPFTDRVRDAQDHWGFDDGAASRMAILGMEQYGLMLSALCPALVPATTIDDIYAVLKRAGVPVWLPYRMLLREEESMHNWAVTSDSLAAWIARHLNAQALVLVKSCAQPPQGTPSEELARLGIVDAGFPIFAKDGGFECHILSRAAPSALGGLLLRPLPA